MSRLCSAANAGQIIISENSYGHVQDIFEVAELASLRVNGKLKPIRGFNVVGMGTSNQSKIGTTAR